MARVQPGFTGGPYAGPAMHPLTAFSLDQALFLWLNLGPAAPGWAVELAREATLELPEWMVAGTVALALAGQPAWRAQAWRALLAMALAVVAAYLLKHGFDRPRPFALGLGTQWLPHGASAGFPSAHACVAAAWAMSAALAPARPAVRVLLAGVALLVGWSRVALGLHFPLDVLAGAVLGALCALAVQGGAARCARARGKNTPALSPRGRS